VDIELSQLQLGSAFLSLNTVSAGTYGGVRLTFSNPELEIVLADGSLQQLGGVNLPLSPATVTPAFASSLSVAANSHVSFLVDFNVPESIQSPSGMVTGISPVVSLAQLPASGAQVIEKLQDTTGQVSGVSKSRPTGSFTLPDAMTGVALADIQFDGTTDFDEGLEGVIFQVNATSQFVLLVNGERNLSTLASGNFITINADPGRVVYGLESTDLPVNSSAFASGSDLLAGQTVDIEVTLDSLVMSDTGCADVTDNCSASADNVKLKKSTLTAQVTGTSAPNFTLVNLPILFGSLSIFRPISADCQSCAAGLLTVVTSDRTEFENAPGGLSALQVRDNVTARGFLIKNGLVGPGPLPAGSPQLVAAKVRRLTP
jgi:hypothetical protein